MSQDMRLIEIDDLIKQLAEEAAQGDVVSASITEMLKSQRQTAKQLMATLGETAP